MKKLTIRNHAFDRFGNQHNPVIDQDHFMGHTAFDHQWKKETPGAIDLRRSEELLVLDINAIGYSRDDLTVAISDGILVVRGMKKHMETHPETPLIEEEIEVETFERKIRVNPGISREKITADLHDGVLRLTFIDVPEEEEKNSRLIEVM